MCRSPTPRGSAIVAAPLRIRARSDRRLLDILGPSQPLTAIAKRIGGRSRNHAPSTASRCFCHRAPSQCSASRDHAAPRRGARRVARRHHAGGHAFGHHGFVVLMLGFAFLWQSRLSAKPPHRGYGAQPHRHRAQPRPLRVVGLGPRARPRLLVAFDVRHSGSQPQDKLLGFGEVSALVHPDDVAALRTRDPARRCQGSFDRPRLPHAPCGWQLGVAARALRTGASGRESGAHLIGIAVDITEQKTLASTRSKPTAAARRHRNDLRSLRGVGRAEPAGAVQLEIPGAARSARRGDRGRHPIRGSRRGRAQAGRALQVSSEGQLPGARTFEAQLDDGRWLQISEQRTKDGGYVSVGTDITSSSSTKKS